MNLSPWHKRTGINARRYADIDPNNPDYCTITTSGKKISWLDARQVGIGGSDIAAICNLNPFKSPLDVYLDKTGRSKPFSGNSNTKWGKLLEPVVAEEYATLNNAKIEKVNAILQHPVHDWALANIDRLCTRKDIPSNGILEVKCTAWGQSWSDNSIPDMYLTQAYWYTGVTDLKWLDFAVLINGNTFHQPSSYLPYNASIVDNLLNTAGEWWHKHVIKDTPPPPTGDCREALAILYPNANKQRIILPESFNELAKKRVKLKNAIDNAKSQLQAIDNQVLYHLKNNSYGLTDNARFSKVVVSKQSVSTKLLKEKYPDIYSELANQTEFSYIRCKLFS